MSTGEMGAVAAYVLHANIIPHSRPTSRLATHPNSPATQIQHQGLTCWVLTMGVEFVCSEVEKHGIEGAEGEE